MPWLHRTCGQCRFCRSGRENLCENAQFTGWDVDGGFAEYMVAPAEFVYRLPEDMDDLAAAPLLCAGIIGYRCLRLVGIVGDGAGLPGAAAAGGIEPGSAAGPRRLGLYGFGSAAHLCTQVARWRGWEVYAFTRGAEHRSLALELGAAWAGETSEDPGVLLDAAIIFAPAGELAVDALRRTDKGGIVALGGIYSTPIPPIEYPWIYHERVVRSVANSTRQDARELLRDARPRAGAQPCAGVRPRAGQRGADRPEGRPRARVGGAAGRVGRGPAGGVTGSGPSREPIEGADGRRRTAPPAPSDIARVTPAPSVASYAVEQAEGGLAGGGLAAAGAGGDALAGCRGVPLRAARAAVAPRRSRGTAAR